MTTENQKPVIFLAFANDRVDGGKYLRNLPDEKRRIREALEKAEQDDLCEVVDLSNTTVKEIFDIFQKQKYKDRIAIFHYGGHAGDYALLLETTAGEHAIAHSEGLDSFLAKQKGLQLIFINGCCSQKQAQDLIKAGVPAVIGTSQKINDEVATDVSVQFYNALAEGRSLDRAWAEAADLVKTKKDTTSYRDLVGEDDIEETEDGFPWHIFYQRDNAEIVKEWSLPAAANQPLFGLPLPEAYYRKLPSAPFVWLQDFKREDAAIFFGRGAEIRKLYTQIITGMQPIILFYGKAGVGKSSLLQAGLAPRIENDHTVKYIRRQAKGLTGTLMQALQEVGDEHGLPPVEPAEKNNLRTKIEELQKALDGSTGFARQVLENELQKLTAHSAATLTLLEYWRRIEEKTDRPLMIFLDQVEETFTRPTSGDELAVFAEAVRNIFDQKDQRPRGKLILSFRKEYHSEIRDAFQALYSEMLLPLLNREGIIAAVEGLLQHPYTREKYRLEIEESKEGYLPKIIAEDLREDEESPVAPVLQIVLTKLWNVAVKDNADAPYFKVRQYQELKQTGAIMSEFFRQQMGRVQDWQKHVVESGLMLDLLYRHTTPAGTAESLSREQLREIYRDRQDMVDRLTAKCKDLYLLTEVQLRGTCLIHNLLAPVVIKEYSLSVKPGQQAARILNSKIEEFRANPKDIWLNDADLEIVEKGREGMGQLNADEEQLLQKSRDEKEKRERERKRNRTIRKVLGAAIVFFAILAGWQWRASVQNYKKSRANFLAVIANEALKTDNTKALRIAEAAYAIVEKAPLASGQNVLSAAFHSQTRTPFYAANFPHAEQVKWAIFSPDGRRILTAADDDTVKLWDEEGNLLDSGENSAGHLASFSAEGKRLLAVATESAANGANFDYNDLKRRLQQKEEIYKISFSPTQKRLLTFHTNGKLKLWDGAENFLKELEHPKEIIATSFSADGSQLLTVAGDSTVRWWDENGHLRETLKYRNDINNAAFSLDGRQILTAAKDYTAKRWDFSKKLLLRLPRHHGAVNSAAFSPDGKYFLTASHDSTAALWDEQGKLIDRLQHRAQFDLAIFSADGKKILTVARDSSARLWIPAEKKIVKFSHGGAINAALFSPHDEKILTASADSTARLWTSNGELLQTFPHQGEVKSAVFSADGKNILTAAADSAARLWGINGSLLKTFRHHGIVNQAIFSPQDQKRILTVSADSTAQLWRNDGTRLMIFKHANEVTAAEFAPNARYLLTASGRKAFLWSKAGKFLDSFEHDYAITAIHFSPDGKTILTAAEDSHARLWNLDGELLANFAQHTDAVNTAVFSPDGRRILTAANDSEPRIWWTPPAIYEWLQTAPVYRLTRKEKAEYEITP